MAGQESGRLLGKLPSKASLHLSHTSKAGPIGYAVPHHIICQPQEVTILCVHLCIHINKDSYFVVIYIYIYYTPDYMYLYAHMMHI